MTTTTKRKDGKWYTVVATEGRFWKGKDGKNDSVTVVVRTVEGPETGVEEKVYLDLGERSIEYSVKKLRALGWTCDDITVLTGLGSLKAAMVVNYAPAKNGGEPFRNVNIMPLKPHAHDEEGLREMAKKYAGFAKAIPTVAATADNLAGVLPPARMPSPKAAKDSDLPF